MRKSNLSKKKQPIFKTISGKASITSSINMILKQKLMTVSKLSILNKKCFTRKNKSNLYKKINIWRRHLPKKRTPFKKKSIKSPGKKLNFKNNPSPSPTKKTKSPTSASPKTKKYHPLNNNCSSLTKSWKKPGPWTEQRSLNFKTSSWKK